MSHQRSSINALPDDVLVDIFKRHVWKNLDTPLRLLRICKRWHGITTNTSSLWGDLVLCDGLPEHSPVGYCFGAMSAIALNNKIICRSVRSLVTAIERTHDSMFELTIVPLVSHELHVGQSRNEPSIDEDWEALDSSWFSQRCRVLRLTIDHSGPLLSQIRELNMLERLEIHGSMLGAEVTLPLLEIVQRSSRCLRSLTTPVGSSPAFRRLDSLFRRLTTLHIRADEGTHVEHITKAAISVRTLGVNQMSSAVSGPPIDCGSSAVDNLTLTNTPCHKMSPNLASTIQYLYLNAPFDRFNGTTIELPRLTQLSYAGYWPTLVGIQAPNLKYLKLLKGSNFGTYDLATLRNTQLRPERLDIDMSCTDREARQLIEDNWSTLKDLQIVYTHSDGSLRRKLAGYLKGRRGEKPLCPDLRRIVILSPERLAKRKEKRQEESEELLMGIRDALKGNGLLKEVKYGWYDYEWYDGSVAWGEDPRECRISWTKMMG